MPIDPFSEGLAHVERSGSLLPAPSPRQKAAFEYPIRWATRGSRGIVLDALRTPGGLVTTKEALRRFFCQLSTTPPLPLPNQSPAQNDRHHAAVEEGTPATIPHLTKITINTEMTTNQFPTDRKTQFSTLSQT